MSLVELRKVLAAVSLALLWLITAACAADGDSETDRVISSGDLLVEFWGPEAALEAERRFEARVAECMKALGFEYVPRDVAARTLQYAPEGVPGTEEFAREYGLGIFPLMLSSVSQFEGEDLDSVPPDANAQRLLTLSDGQREAWLEALNEPGVGCLDRAQVARSERDAAYALAGESYQEWSALVAADPRSAELDREWSDCMIEAGFQFRSPADLETLAAELNSELNRHLGSLPRTQVGAGDSVPVFDKDYLARRADEEIAVAVGDARCSQRFLDERRRIEADYESCFAELVGPPLAELRNLRSG